MKLYTFFRSSAAFRVRIALNLKGLTYESIPKAFAKNEHRAADYLAVNPQGLIPALDTDGAVLSQSLAIIEYLDEMHPTPPSCRRTPSAARAVRSMALAIVGDIHPLNNLRVLNYLTQAARAGRQRRQHLVSALDHAKASGPGSSRRASTRSGNRLLLRRSRCRSRTSAWCRRCSTRVASTRT